jgi:hypothetical protein
MAHSYYNNAENLTGTMLEFGKHVLRYEPPGGAPIEAEVEMRISTEATVPEMLQFFTDYLKVSGYYIDEDKELVFERKAPDFGDISDNWDFGVA